MAKPGTAALGENRLIGVEKGYFHGEGIGKASAVLVGSQAEIPITADWGGGMVASTDGLRFVVPVRSLHSRPSPLYFGVGKRPRGTTWLNTVSDKVMGLGGLVVPGTMRDSMYILDAIHRLDATEHPDIITTDTGSYSDIVYGMFAVCGYQFAPRHADISDTQLWWVDTAMTGGEVTRGHRISNGWGAFNELQLRRVSVPAILREWDDMTRVAGSLATGQVRAYDLIKMMTAGGRLTGLGNAFAAYGRIFKTLHLLQVIHVEAYRRMIGAQLNVGESRHQLARRVFFGNLGRLVRAYERGMENQLGALGLGLNAITWWNSLYINAAVDRLEAGGSASAPRSAPACLPWGSSTSTSTAPTPSTAPTCKDASAISAISATRTPPRTSRRNRRPMNDPAGTPPGGLLYRASPAGWMARPAGPSSAQQQRPRPAPRGPGERDTCRPGLPGPGHPLSHDQRPGPRHRPGQGDPAARPDPRRGPHRRRTPPRHLQRHRHRDHDRDQRGRRPGPDHRAPVRAGRPRCQARLDPHRRSADLTAGFGPPVR